MNFTRILEQNPVIAAVKDEAQLDKAIKNDIEIIFVLFGNILNVREISEKISKSNKIGIVHFDLIEGLAKQEISLQYLKNNTSFKGIISTKPLIIKHAKNLGFIAVQRVFIMDSISLRNVQAHLVSECDALEMIPGVLFKVMKNLVKNINKPLIAGGLISDKSDVMNAIDSGATCISTTKEEIWNM